MFGLVHGGHQPLDAVRRATREATLARTSMAPSLPCRGSQSETAVIRHDDGPSHVDNELPGCRRLEQYGARHPAPRGAVHGGDGHARRVHDHRRSGRQRGRAAGGCDGTAGPGPDAAGDFVGDYATITFAIGPNDPLQACAAAFQESYINDPFVMRRALSMVLTAGFEDALVRSHGYVQVERPDYMLSVADRGADALAAGGMLDQAGAAALKAEARRRVSDGRFFGHIAYLSIVARKPSP